MCDLISPYVRNAAVDNRFSLAVCASRTDTVVDIERSFMEAVFRYSVSVAALTWCNHCHGNSFHSLFHFWPLPIHFARTNRKKVTEEDESLQHLRTDIIPVAWNAVNKIINAQPSKTILKNRPSMTIGTVCIYNFANERKSGNDSWSKKKKRKVRLFMTF
jgi:hypothetical protein